MNSIKEILTLPNKIFIGLLFGGLLIVFTPYKIAEKLYIIPLREEYGFIIGPSVVVISSLLFVNLLYKVSSVLRDKKLNKNFPIMLERKLKTLNDLQKTIIYSLYLEDDFTMPLPKHNGAVIEMEHYRMISVIPGAHVVDLENTVVPYMLQPFVSEQLKNKDYLRDEFKEIYEQRKNKMNKEKGWL